MRLHGIREGAELNACVSFTIVNPKCFQTDFPPLVSELGWKDREYMTYGTSIPVLLIRKQIATVS